MKTVAVISKTQQDFNDWKISTKFDCMPSMRNENKFTVLNTRYVCITNQIQLRGYRIDEIIETERASENELYDKIKEAIIHCIGYKTNNCINCLHHATYDTENKLIHICCTHYTKNIIEQPNSYICANHSKIGVI